jgi:hypothetical protein
MRFGIGEPVQRTEDPVLLTPAARDARLIEWAYKRSSLPAARSLIRKSPGFSIASP